MQCKKSFSLLEISKSCPYSRLNLVDISWKTDCVDGPRIPNYLTTWVCQNFIRRSFSMNSACWRRFCWQTLYSTQLTHPMNQCKTLGCSERRPWVEDNVAIGNQVQYNAELAIFWYWMHRSVWHCPLQLVNTNINGCNAALLLVRE